MSLSNKVTEYLNGIEAFAENASIFLFPLKLLAWTLLLFALMLTNLIAIIHWPISILFKKPKGRKISSRDPVNVKSVEELTKLISQHDIVLVDFWAEWCGPCLLMNNAIKVISSKYANEITVAKVDASLNMKISKSNNIKGLPTVIIFREGVEFIRKSGTLTIVQLSELIDESLV